VDVEPNEVPRPPMQGGLMSKWLGLGGVAVCGVGIFFGFFYYAANPDLALAIVTATTVGVVGVLAWLRHFIFYKSDMKRLGWETPHPDWMWEVGFANGAFGFMGLYSVLGGLDVQAQAVTLLGYAVYLFQASILHGYRYFTDEVKKPQRLWQFCILTAVLAAMMSFFAISALMA